jgi:DNA helicase INO80
MPTTSSVQQPKMFHGSLKEYQLKGLQWLVNCYEQGLNGILADEMGLGKTIQAMAFLGHLAEEKNIWGPFLVVAPASVLNNWADEVNRFCPDLRILPYWGAANERAVLRKNINPNRLYRREAGFHVLITSYQLLVSDEKYFKRVKWQYMVLDEAQAIKSASSQRWKTLLSFNCRNRLLLTGTPIQNSMAELWALLHFIMPTLFDSHEQFNEWFSKGIEGHAEHGGTLNEHQLTRLHSILKPFMLRRVKKDVITEMTNKKEVVVPCSLSSRQQALYQAIKNKISVADLFAGGQLNDKKVLNLMNIVIQLRKVNFFLVFISVHDLDVNHHWEDV